MRLAKTKTIGRDQDPETVGRLWLMVFRVETEREAEGRGCIRLSLLKNCVFSKIYGNLTKAKRTRAPAYSRALRRIKVGFPKGGQSREA